MERFDIVHPKPIQGQPILVGGFPYDVWFPDDLPIDWGAEWNWGCDYFQATGATGRQRGLARRALLRSVLVRHGAKSLTEGDPGQNGNRKPDHLSNDVLEQLTSGQIDQLLDLVFTRIAAEREAREAAGEEAAGAGVPLCSSDESEPSAAPTDGD